MNRAGARLGVQNRHVTGDCGGRPQKMGLAQNVAKCRQEIVFTSIGRESVGNHIARADKCVVGQFGQAVLVVVEVPLGDVVRVVDRRTASEETVGPASQASCSRT